MPEDLRKLILDNDYVICDSYKDKKIINFNNEIDFINWFKENKNKKIASERNINIQSIKKMNSLCFHSEFVPYQD